MNEETRRSSEADAAPPSHTDPSDADPAAQAVPPVGAAPPTEAGWPDDLRPLADRDVPPPPPVAWAPAQPGPTSDPAPGWGAPIAWEAPDPASSRATFDVGATFGGTLSSFARWWPLYAALSLPTAIIGMVISQIGVEAVQQGSVIFLSLINLPLSIVLGLAMTVVADEARSGRRPDLGVALRRSAGRFLHALGAGILAALAFCVILAVPLALMASSAVVGSLLFLALFGVVFYLVGRWALIFPAIVLEELGPIEGMRRSWHLTKGNMWRLVALFIFLTLLAAPLGIAVGLLAFGGDPLWVPLTGLATILTTPLTSIALALAHAEITGRPRDPDVVAKRPTRGRAVLAAGIVGLGVVLLVPASLTAGPSFERLMTEGMTASIPDSERGQLVTGLDEGPATSCRPGRLTSTVGRHDEIYLGGYFTRAVQPSEDAVFEVYVDEVLIASNQLNFPMVSVCYFEGPILDLAPARYRFVVRVGSETIAEGLLTVV